jgi:hypothetical protein
MDNRKRERYQIQYSVLNWQTCIPILPSKLHQEMQQQRKLWLYYWDLKMCSKPKLSRLYRACRQMLYHYHLNRALVRRRAARVAQSWERGSTVWKKRSRGSRPRSLVLGVLSGSRACRAAVLLRRRGSRWCPVVHSVLLLDTPFASQCHPYAQTYPRSPTCPLSTSIARTWHNIVDHTMQMHDKLDNRRKPTTRMSINKKVTSLHTLRICTTPLGLPPQSVVLWQVCKLHIYTIGICCFRVIRC